MTNPVWGVPWHGRVRSGQLTLPNGQAMPWPQPDGTSADILPDDRSKWSPDHAGFTHLQKMPGVPVVARTSEELAADQAAGRQWLDCAILAGASDTASSKSYLHGKQASGWIYAAPDGSKWRIPGLGRYAWSSAFGVSMTLSPRRFGVLGGASVTHYSYLALTNAQMGQSNWDALKDSVPRYCQMQAITPAGDKAIFMLYREGEKELPHGFLLLTITGTPGVDMVMTLAPLRTAAQTAGTLSIDNAATTKSVYRRIGVTTTYEDVDGVYCEVKAYSGVTWGESLPGGEFTVSAGTNRLELAGRVVAMWFDDDGAPQEVTLDISRASTMSIPTPDSSYSGRDVRPVGSSTLIEYGVIAESWVSSRTDSDTWTLRAGSHSVSFASSQTVTRNSQRDRDSSGGGSTVHTRGESFTVGAWSGGGADTAVRENTWGVGSVSVESFRPYDADFKIRADQFFSEAVASYQLRIKRWANNLIGFAASRLYVSGAGAGSIAWSSSVSTSGVIAGDAEQSAAIDATAPWYTYRPYGALNPITGEAVIASADPVSWT